MCYYAEFGRSAFKSLGKLGINTGEQQNWATLELRCLGMGDLADALETNHSHMC